MTITYKIHQDLGLVVTRYLDTVTDDEFISFYERLLADPAMRPGFSELADMTEWEIEEVTEAGLEKVGQMMESFLGTPPVDMRSAVVVTRAQTFELISTYQKLNEETSEDVKVFYDSNEALKWLELEPVPLSELH